MSKTGDTAGNQGALAVAEWWAERWNWGIIARWDPVALMLARRMTARLSDLLADLMGQARAGDGIRIDVSPLGDVDDVLRAAEEHAFASVDGPRRSPGGFYSGWTVLYPDHAVAWSDRGRVLLWAGPGFDAQGLYGFCTSLPVPSLGTVRAVRCSLPTFHEGPHVFTRPVSLCRVCGREVTACAGGLDGWHTCDPLPPGEDWEFMVPGWVPR